MQLIGTIVALFSLSSPRSRRKNHLLSRNKSKNNNHHDNQNQKLSQNQRNKLNIHDTKVKWAHETNAAILIDVENVRGKSNFELTHDQILHQIPRWASFHHLTGQVSLVVDHGSVPSAHYLSDEQLGVVFAGPRIKADDVIARDVAFFASHTNDDDHDNAYNDNDGEKSKEKRTVGGGQTVMVITADNELMSRCRNAMSKAMLEDPRTLSEPNIQFVHPLQFICDLEVVMKEQDQKQKQQQSLQVAESSSVDSVPVNDGGSSSDKYDNDNNTSPFISKELANQIEEEIKLRGAMYETEMQMRLKRNMNTPKKRRKLEKRARMICERLARKGGGQSIDHLTAVDDGMSDYDRQFQDEVLAQWENLRRTATRREMTGDRMLLAERFRRQIDKREKEGQHRCGEGNVVNGGDAVMKSHSYSHVQYIKALMNTKSATSMSSGRRVSSSSTISTTTSISSDSNSSSPSSSSSLRLVVVSDTHGYEESLTPNGSTLPDGDILLHLGDFAIDSSMKKKLKALEKFDEWLARQPHRTKIVLRGNHDPFKVHFPLSNANYYSRPTSIAIDGKYTISLVPYCSSRILSGSWRKLPMFCDVLASHVPPHKILDKCYNGQNAGCSTLRGKVERMIAGPPKLWLCGHIHEGRGLVREKFGFSPRETTVINAANANLGRATHIEYGPVVVGLNDVNGDDVEVLQMDRENVEVLVTS